MSEQNITELPDSSSSSSSSSSSGTSGSSSSSSGSSSGSSSSSSSSSSSETPVTRTPLQISKSLKQREPDTKTKEESPESSSESSSESKESPEVAVDTEPMNKTEDKPEQKEDKDDKDDEVPQMLSDSSDDSGDSSDDSGDGSESDESEDSESEEESEETKQDKTESKADEDAKGDDKGDEEKADDEPVEPDDEEPRQLSKTPVEQEETRIEKILNMYFKIKNAYEIKKKSILKDTTIKEPTEKRKNIQRIKCIFCGRQVTTEFGRQGQILFARCGDRKQPCPLDIRINRGNFVQIENVKGDLESEVRELETQMSIIKMKLLYGQLTETEASSLFSEIEVTYNQYTMYLNDLQKDYDRIHFEYREENGKERFNQLNNDLYVHIKEFQELIRLYKNSDNTDNKLLRDAIKKYVDDIYPIQREIRMLRYSVYEVSEIPFDESSQVKTKIVPKKLFGFPYTLDDTEMTSDEPSILAFYTKKYKIKPDEIQEDSPE